MVPRGSGESALRQARRLLLDRGEVPNGLIDELVARSWRRSFKAGLAPMGRGTDSPHLSGSEFDQAAQRKRDLIALARPVMEYLHGQTRDSGSMVILADDQGFLLQAMGDADFLSRAERVALMPGATWDERFRGTNAIGTALAEAAPVVVHGSEHYLERNAFLTCAAAPVNAPDGRLLGVLDISGEQRSRHPHTFGLVRAAAQMIENRLFEARYGDGLRLRFHPMAEGIGTVAEGILALREDGWILGANQVALRLLGLIPEEIGTLPLSRVLDLSLKGLQGLEWNLDLKTRLLRRPSGGLLFVRVEPGRRPPMIFAPGPPPESRPDPLSRLDTGDPRMRTAVHRARKVAGKPIPVLLLGESGVGKELFTRAFHESGPRKGKPFVAVNCAAMPESLIEAELFGYSPGAFTGARRDGSPGRIREAHGGTLFLDEVGDMPLSAQARLLRVIQERQVTPLGGGATVPVDFALVCATHQDLKVLMDTGRFRPDLYYRINGLALSLPSLRERGDFPTLLARMISDLAPGRRVVLDPALAERFAAHPWPGNLRQLDQVIRTACALMDDEETVITWHHLPDDLAEELEGKRKPTVEVTAGNLRACSDTLIRQTVRLCEGNMSEAARKLGISRNTLYRRLKRGRGAEFPRQARERSELP